MAWEIAVLGFIAFAAFLFAYVASNLDESHSLLKFILFSMAIIVLIIGGGTTINVADMNPVNATAMPYVNTTLASQRVQTNTQSFYQVLIWGSILITIYLLMHWAVSVYKNAKGMTKR